MKDYIQKIILQSREIAILGGVVLVGFVLVAGGFFFMFKSTSDFKKEVATSNKLLNDKLENLEAALATTTLSSAELAERLKKETEDFKDTIDDISDTVGTLEKLSKTDRELLQKYSKVYFLSDNYVPMRLSNIDKNYLSDPTKNLQFHASALRYLEDMLDAAKDQDIDIRVVSAYRSFGTQSGLKASYLTTYGTGANAFAADQGYSEHQLGTTLDLTAFGQGVDLTTTFENTDAFKWLSANAYRYGFVLSYPPGNKYYQYEPWHWRFVGKSLATRLYRDGIHFSDMDQREIDTYLVKIFN